MLSLATRVHAVVQEKVRQLPGKPEGGDPVHLVGGMRRVRDVKSTLIKMHAYLRDEIRINARDSCSTSWCLCEVYATSFVRRLCDIFVCWLLLFTPFESRGATESTSTNGSPR